MNHKTVNVEVNNFDYIRIIIATVILLGHFLGHFRIDNPIIYKIAYIVRGVPLFFCLSGFLVARSVERYPLKEFWMRRFFRIFPALWVCVLLNLMIIIFGAGFYPTIKEIILYLVTQLTVFHFYTGSWLSQYGVGVPNGALWTITVDIQFYILVYWFAKRLKDASVKTWMLLLSFLAILAIVLEKFNTLYPEFIYKLLSVSILPFLYIFLFGMMVYYKRDIIIPNLTKYCFPIVALYIVWNFIPSHLIIMFEGVRYNVITTFLLMIALFALAYSGTGKRLKVDYSYAFYLYHMVVLNAIHHFYISRLENNLFAVLIFLITTILTSVFAFLSVHIIDKKLSFSMEKRYFIKKENNHVRF